MRINGFNLGVAILLFIAVGFSIHENQFKWVIINSAFAIINMIYAFDNREAKSQKEKQ